MNKVTLKSHVFGDHYITYTYKCCSSKSSSIYWCLLFSPLNHNFIGQSNALHWSLGKAAIRSVTGRPEAAKEAFLPMIEWFPILRFARLNTNINKNQLPPNSQLVGR